jgi:hypothetical protein
LSCRPDDREEPEHLNGSRLLLMRFAGVALVLLLFGAALGFDLVHYGDRARAVRFGPVVVGLVFGLYAILALWSASTYAYADRLAMLMAALFVVGYPLRLFVDHVSWDAVVRNALIVVGGLVLAAGKGKPDDEVPLVRLRRRSEARGLPRLNRRRAKKGLPPVASFDEARNERRWWR